MIQWFKPLQRVYPWKNVVGSKVIRWLHIFGLSSAPLVRFECDLIYIIYSKLLQRDSVAKRNTEDVSAIKRKSANYPIKPEEVYSYLKTMISYPLKFNSQQKPLESYQALLRKGWSEPTSKPPESTNEIHPSHRKLTNHDYHHCCRRSGPQRTST